MSLPLLKHNGIIIGIHVIVAIDHIRLIRSIQLRLTLVIMAPVLSTCHTVCTLRLAPFILLCHTAALTITFDEVCLDNFHKVLVLGAFIHERWFS